MVNDETGWSAEPGNKKGIGAHQNWMGQPTQRAAHKLLESVVKHGRAAWGALI